MTPRDADAAMAASRLRKAQEFADAAEIFVEPSGAIESRDAFVTLAVHAGIAAADSICIRRLGRYSPTGGHADSVAILASADAESAKHLDRLLKLKTKAGYSARPVTAVEADSALRSCRALVERAFQIG